MQYLFVRNTLRVIIFDMCNDHYFIYFNDMCTPGRNILLGCASLWIDDVLRTLTHSSVGLESCIFRVITIGVVTTIFCLNDHCTLNANLVNYNLSCIIIYKNIFLPQLSTTHLISVVYTWKWNKCEKTLICFNLFYSDEFVDEKKYFVCGYHHLTSLSKIFTNK